MVTWGTSRWDVASLGPQTSVPQAYAAEAPPCLTTVPSQIHTAPPAISLLVWRWPRHFSSFPQPLPYKDMGAQKDPLPHSAASSVVSADSLAITLLRSSLDECPRS